MHGIQYQMVLNITSWQELNKHFVKHTRATKHNTVWLVCDNHDSHISVEVLDFKIGIVVLSFTPHCSHKLQAVQRSYFSYFFSKVLLYPTFLF